MQEQNGHRRREYCHQCEIEHRVSFFENDPMKVVWHGNYLKYFEMGREALFRKYRYDYRKIETERSLWPVVESFAKYRASMSYEQLITIRAFILEFENRLKIGYEVYREHDTILCCEGYTIQVSVNADTHELNFVSPKFLFYVLGEPYPCY